MTTTIAIASGKGGVGKTTIAVNLSLSLALQNKDTLLFDADLGMANAHILLGINPELSLENFTSVFFVFFCACEISISNFFLFNNVSKL